MTYLEKEKMTFTILICLISCLTSIIISFLLIQHYIVKLNSPATPIQPYQSITQNITLNTSKKDKKDDIVLTNINTTTPKELKVLSNIEKGLALSTVKNKPYKSRNDLNKVKGMNNKTIENMKGKVK